MAAGSFVVYSFVAEAEVRRRGLLLRGERLSALGVRAPTAHSVTSTCSRRRTSGCFPCPARNPQSPALLQCVEFLDAQDDDLRGRSMTVNENLGGRER